jgi:hypothetical protein
MLPAYKKGMIDRIKEDNYRPRHDSYRLVAQNDHIARVRAHILLTAAFNDIGA